MALEVSEVEEEVVGLVAGLAGRDVVAPEAVRDRAFDALVADGGRGGVHKEVVGLVAHVAGAKILASYAVRDRAELALGRNVGGVREEVIVRLVAVTALAQAGALQAVRNHTKRALLGS